MGARVEAELRTLALGGARFLVSVGARAAGPDTLALGDLHVGAKGLDRVEFLFAPNPGEEARPLQRIASGGELSRVTLALKNVLAARDPVGTYVFDEVDAGVGGAVGEVLGRKLRDVSKHRQIICITHLPQIAAFADAHFLVEKRIADGRTLAEVRALDARSRKEELARMLGGVKITARTRAHAEEMLRSARG
jgi:DNA repair protein RecN (Recombination protein N)